MFPSVHHFSYQNKRERPTHATQCLTLDATTHTIWIQPEAMRQSLFSAVHSGHILIIKSFIICAIPATDDERCGHDE